MIIHLPSEPIHPWYRAGDYCTDGRTMVVARLVAQLPERLLSLQQPAIDLWLDWVERPSVELVDTGERRYYDRGATTVTLAARDGVVTRVQQIYADMFVGCEPRRVTYSRSVDKDQLAVSWTLDGEIVGFTMPYGDWGFTTVQCAKWKPRKVTKRTVRA